ncbi:MAG: hypothetical protein IT276_11635 [Ignavibacteriaceae bacterium]|nr:hypothetical protein [Ignavibacteriaceae bacterium]
MKRFISVLSLVLLFTVLTSAQFTPNKHYLGPSIGLSFLGSTPQFGANYEYSMVVKDFGTIGIGGILRYWSYSEDFYDGGWKYTDILIGAQGNYHFKLDTDKFDPWIGLTLAYDAGSVSWDGPSGSSYSSPTYGGFFIGANAGARYWVSPTVGLSARVGFGSLSYGGLDLGVDFKF